MKFYVVLGYQYLGMSELSSCYYHWLRLERVLRGVFASVHSIYTASSTALNSLCQAIRPAHPIAARPEMGAVIEERRRLLLYAVASHDIGDLIRRTVRMAGEPIISLRELEDSIVSRIALFRTSLVSAHKEPSLHPFKVFLDREELAPVKRPPSWSAAARDVKYSMRTTLLDIILIEMFSNALSYCNVEIITSISLDDRRVSVSVENDLLVPASSRGLGDQAGKALGGQGVHACEAAAAASGGSFSSDATPEGGWKAVLVLPVVKLQNSLASLLDPR